MSANEQAPLGLTVEQIRLIAYDQHRMNGDCPDYGQPDARDPECKSCQVLLLLDASKISKP